MPRRERESRYWGKRALTYDDALCCTVGCTIIHEIEGWLEDQSVDTDTVLEMGCGSGFFSGTIARKAKHLTATDLAREMVEEAGETLSKYGNVKVQTEDCYNTSFKDAIFDGVLLVNLLHIVKDPIAVLAEAHRVLKDDGRVVVVDITACGMSIPARVGMMLRYCQRYGMPCTSGKNLNPDGLAEIARKTGFVVEECKLIGKTTKAVCLRGKKVK
jgi:ABC-2 type transport system ATP-binding protein